MGFFTDDGEQAAMAAVQPGQDRPNPMKAAADRYRGMNADAGDQYQQQVKMMGQMRNPGGMPPSTQAAPQNSMMNAMMRGGQASQPKLYY